VRHPERVSHLIIHGGMRAGGLKRGATEQHDAAGR
jgi:hypothetical protein